MGVAEKTLYLDDFIGPLGSRPVFSNTPNQRFILSSVIGLQFFSLQCIDEPWQIFHCNFLGDLAYLFVPVLSSDSTVLWGKQMMMYWP
jgi:hypothetical protein